MHLHEAHTVIESGTESDEASPPLNLESTLKKLSVEQIDSIDGRYEAFKHVNVRPEHAYTGWSTAVMGTGPFGWSDALLNGYEMSLVTIDK